MDAHSPGRKPQCDDAVHTLYHFLDGELTIQKRADIQRHLDECLPCLEAFDFEAELRTVIANKCRDQVPDSLRMRVADAIHHEETHGTPPGGIPTL
ncbi:MAG TPA: mycothiol system anti-sigma-R factor [Acidimicrobiales bacterium]